MSKSSKETDDCLACRLISGFGIIGIGVYVYYQAKKRKSLENYTMKAISAGAVTLGVARLFNMQFLKSTKDDQ